MEMTGEAVVAATVAPLHFPNCAQTSAFYNLLDNTRVYNLNVGHYSESFGMALINRLL